MKRQTTDGENICKPCIQQNITQNSKELSKHNNLKNIQFENGLEHMNRHFTNKQM